MNSASFFEFIFIKNNILKFFPIFRTRAFFDRVLENRLIKNYNFLFRAKQAINKNYCFL